MKFFLHIFVIIALSGCKSTKTSATASEETSEAIKISEKKEIISQTDCPETGMCRVELIPNSTLEIHQDKFKNTYTNITKGEKLIFKFNFSRDLDKQYVDGHYIEEVYAEFDANLPEITLKGKELQDAKLLFNRMCYCKGSAGYYPIKNGTLSMKKIDDKTYDISINFKMDEVPQVITSINERLIFD